MSDQWSVKGTRKGYAPSWRRWLHYCARIGFNPVCGPDLRDTLLRHLAAFLNDLSEERGLAGGTVHNARSSLCGGYELLLGERKLARHPWLASVAKTADNRKPKKPRYDETWDAGMVVGYWARTPTPTLALKRDRAISLGFLALFARPSDLERISRLPAHWQVTRAGFRFRIRGPKEAKSQVALSKWIELPFLPTDALDDDTLGCCSCAARAWQSYFDALESEGVSHLPLEVDESFPVGRFLALRPTPVPGLQGTFHVPLGSQRISNLMKAVMSLAGVDTRVFTGGSGRSAGSSAAAARGDDMLRVLETGRWSSFRNFKKYYLRARLSLEQSRLARELD